MAFSFDDFLRTVPVAELAEQFGVSEGDIAEAVSLAAPTLLGGMAMNAESSEGASKLIAATEQHQRSASSLAEIDTKDGKKIVGRVLGASEDQVTTALTAKAGNDTIASLIPKLLPILAPLIMQFLAGGLTKGSTSGSSSDGMLSDLLGGLLGGGSSQGGPLQGGLGGLLGTILGK